MKTIKFLMMLVVSTLFITACVQDDDYTIPESFGTEENKGLTKIMQEITDGTLTEISVASLKSLFAGENVLIESNIVVKGYVSSSDQTGNFFKEFYLQDAPENPTAAIGVILNQVDSYNQFNLGREVYIKLKDLYLGENSSDIISVGGKLDDGGYLDDMTENQISTHVFRSANTMELVPLNLSPSDVNDSHVGMYVTFQHVQIPMGYAGATFHNPINDFETRYPLKSCQDGSEFLLETSSFASFKQEPLPVSAGGTISGVVSQGFGGSPTVLVLNSTDDINFTENRCDPLFEDSFSAGNLNKWTTYSVVGAEQWYYNTFGNPSDSATMSGFNGGNRANEDWLISKPIDLSGVTGAILKFQSVKRFAGNDLQLFMATTYNGGDPNTDGNWTQLSATFDTNINTYSSWTNSGDVDVSAAAGGNLYIAFKYTSTTSASSTFEIDNVEVVEQ